VYDKIVRLKLPAEDGKMRETDVADTETLLRLIQSISFINNFASDVGYNNRLNVTSSVHNYIIVE
jgi:hypothetical protein